MIRALFGWIEDRTGLGKLCRETLYERIPGGPRWRYVWGSTIVFAIAVQFVTGAFLWMAYSPGAASAWESVFHLQTAIPGGDLLRGIHRWMADIMVVLLLFHLVQMVVDGAYRAPREINFWLSLAMMGLVLAIARTGYMLPWDQEGLWGTKVAMGYVGVTPVVGDTMQSVAIGGTDYGHATLTRFFALHAGFLPVALVLVMAFNFYLGRRHGRAVVKARGGAKADAKPAPEGAFWPDQLLRNAVACLALLAAVLFFVFWKGTELSAPADPSQPFNAARPDWYFMPLFQLLKLGPFTGATGTLLGAVVIPGVLATGFFLMPIIGRHRLGRLFNVVFLYLFLAAFVALTSMAFYKDAHNASYQAEVIAARLDGERAVELIEAHGGIPPEGALALIYADPATQGPKLYAQNCASCHPYGGGDGEGGKLADEPAAPDLDGVGSRRWIAGLLTLEQFQSAHYFGNTEHKDGKMAETLEDLELTAGDIATIAAALSSEAALRTQSPADAAMIEEGFTLMGDDEFACTDCHKVRGEGSKKAPDLTAYMSRDWLIDFIGNPEHPRFYGEDNDAMPRFLDSVGEDGEPEPGKLNPKQVGLIADWLRGEWPGAHE